MKSKSQTISQYESQKQFQEISKKLFSVFKNFPPKQKEEFYKNFNVFVTISERFVTILAQDSNQNYINESSDNRSVDADKAVELIRQKYNLPKEIFQCTESVHKVKICLLIPDKGTNVDYITKDMEHMNYFLSSDAYKKLDGYSLRVVQYEPLYQNIEKNFFQRNESIYHWTPIYNVKNISQQGLIPKSENNLLKFPPRIYVLEQNFLTEEANMLVRMLNDNNHNPKNKGIYCLLKICVDKLKPSTQFFADPNFRNGFYTTQPIPKESILGIQFTINLNESLQKP